MAEHGKCGRTTKLRPLHLPEESAHYFSASAAAYFPATLLQPALVFSWICLRDAWREPSEYPFQAIRDASLKKLGTSPEPFAAMTHRPIKGKTL
jgi:hypothetical protein